NHGLRFYNFLNVGLLPNGKRVKKYVASYPNLLYSICLKLSNFCLNKNNLMQIKQVARRCIKTHADSRQLIYTVN
uniref:Uncharacterized protein n=1 Tax=Ciona intestinalis TaxID=7719 RepID=H2XTJ8_CIOIN